MIDPVSKKGGKDPQYRACRFWGLTAFLGILSDFLRAGHGQLEILGIGEDLALVGVLL